MSEVTLLKTAFTGGQTIHLVVPTTKYPVILDGKFVGDIVEKDDTFQYFPKGCEEGGDVFASLDLCFESLL